jgi:hypothetical protein
MAKCFLTGIEVQLKDAYLLDRGAAQRALQGLKQRVNAVERLISQLGPKDEIEVFDPKTKTTKTRTQRRLVCRTVAAALSASCQEFPVFIKWTQYTARPAVFPEFQKRLGKAQPEDGNEKPEAPPNEVLQ